MDIAIGFTGFTIDVFRGSTSDSEGDVTKAIFAITFQERVNDVQFSITNVNGHWSALTPTGEYIGLNNPEIISTNKDSAIVAFDMEAKYPSNSMLILAQRSMDAEFNVNELDHELTFTPNTITGAMGFTSNEYGGGTNDEGEVERAVFNISFANRRNEIEFSITEDDNDWAMLMGDGSYINLINPNVLFQNRDGATIVFQMKPDHFLCTGKGGECDHVYTGEALPENYRCPKCGATDFVAVPSVYPSNSPGFLVRRRKEANWTITEIDEEYPFIPIQNVIFPTYIPSGERLNLNAQTVVYPMNSTLRGIEWSIVNSGTTEAVIESGWIETQRPGKITLNAHVTNGAGLGHDYDQEIQVMVIENWIVIQKQPHLKNACIAGRITEFISVLATTEFGDLSYQWYKSPDGTNEAGSPIAGADSPIFGIPKSLVPGDYYFFCEVRKTNFPSVRSEAAFVRVRDSLRSISIFPESASIPPGSTQQFAVDRNPQTADERLPVKWFSSAPWVISIDENGLATSHHGGSTRITAKVGDKTKTITVLAEFIPVQDINWTLPNEIETDKSYALPNTVVPSNATHRSIVWEIVSPGTTGAMISNGKLTCNNIGNLTLRGTVDNGRSLNVAYSREFTISVKKGHIPVSDITIGTINPRAGEIVPLNGTVTPANATNSYIEWRIKDASTTGARLTGGNILTAQTAGTVVVTATVRNGKAASTDYTKDFTINFRSQYVSVERIDNFPAELQYYDGEGDGYKLGAVAMPEDATSRQITYRISENDNSGLSPRIVNGTLVFDNSLMVHTDEKSIVVSIIVKNGLSDGVDYVTESAIFIQPPPAPDVFVPIIKANWDLPSILRAYRPIVTGMTDLTPNDCTYKDMQWTVERINELTDASVLTFRLADNSEEDIIANGVLTTDEFDWTHIYSRYIYPMSAGKMKLRVTVKDGLGVNEDFVDEKVLDVLNPFIKVVDVKNMPNIIYAGTKYILSPEIDTGYGMDQQTAIWDDREATYQNIQFEITRGAENCTLNGNVLTPMRSGEVTIRVTIPNGLMEDYTWHDRHFDRADFIKHYTIRIDRAPTPSKNALIKLKAGMREIGIYTRAQYELLRSIGPADQTLPIGMMGVRRNEITEIQFTEHFNFTDLSNFGRNFTNLTKINKIPDCARNLRNFLRGCSRFNQYVVIPSTVTGDRCLEGFLRDCTSFNQPIIIPSRVSGTKCLESFLRGCTRFNRAIRLPENIIGDCAMYSFLMGCTSFNSRITLPKRITGKRCMENVLRGCTSFNKPIVLPEDISGRYNVAAFMFDCNSFASSVTIPTEAAGEKLEADVITFSTFHRGSTVDTNGINLHGPGAAKFQELTGDQGSEFLVPLRTLKVAGAEIPELPDEGDGYVGVNITNDAVPNLGYDDYVVDDPVEFVVSVMNTSEKKKLTALNLIDVLPAGVRYTSAETDRDLTLIKTMSNDTTIEETLLAPEPEHVHSFTGEWMFDSQGHWRKCSGCDVLSEKELHTPGAAATLTTPQVCSVCGYVIQHALDGTGEGTNPECEHTNLEIKNAIDATTEEAGYSGDTYCVDCGRLIAVGHIVPPIGSGIDPASLMNEVNVLAGGPLDPAEPAETKHKVIFMVNGTKVSEVEVVEGQPVAKPADPTLRGHTFNGWFKDVTFTTAWDFTANVTEPITLYAKFTEIPYVKQLKFVIGELAVGETVTIRVKAKADSVGATTNVVNAEFAESGLLEDAAMKTASASITINTEHATTE